MRNLGKKGFTFLLASSLMFTSGVVPAFANEPLPDRSMKVSAANPVGIENAKISKEKAIEVASKAIPIPKDFVQRNVEFQTNWWGNGAPVWVILWDRQIPPQFGSINIVVDATSGQVVNIEMYNNPTQKSSYPPKVDQAGAKEKALQYIQKHFPEQAKSIVYDNRYEQSSKPPLNGFIEYPIFFKREVNGIPFEGNEIRVNINGDGEVIGLGYRWDDQIQFPSIGNVLSLEQIQKIYKEKINLSLKLLPQWGPNPERKYNLGYIPQNANYYEPNYIRATDGVFLTPWGQEIPADEAGMLPVSDKKLGALANGKNLTQDQALAVLQKHFSLPKDASLMRATYREQWGESQTSAWEFNWETRNDGITAGWSMAVVEAKTGRVLSYSNENHVYMEKQQGPSQEQIPADEKVKLTKDQAEKKAMDLMKQLHPDIAHQLYLLKGQNSPAGPMNTRFHNFSFIRQVNGVSLEYSGININVDALSGEITSYWFDVANLNLPETMPQVIGKDQALETYLERMDLRLMYVVPQPDPVQIMKAGETTKNNQAILVYQPRFKESGEPVYLDAKTGKWTNRETGKSLIDVDTVTDIKGHPAEKELNLLLKYNVFEPKDQKIFPNEEITRGEMIRMLVLLENNGYPVWYDASRAATFKDVAKSSPYFAYIENAVERNLIDRNQENFNPEEKIDREELAKLIIKSLGYDKLAQTEDLFKVDLKDAASIEALGSVILATKLGIMDAPNATFSPDQKVTRAEAAVAFYRYLSKRNDLRNY